jgi:hypothetical protein
MKIMMLQTFFGGIGWWRFQVPAQALRALGHEVYCPTADQLSHAVAKCKNDPFAWLDEEMPKHDLIHVGYSSDPSMAIALFNGRDKHNVPVVTDLDDDIDHVPPYNKGWAGFHPGSRGQKTAKTQLAHSDGITFSTEPLAQVMGYLAKGKPQAILGNYIDVDSWDHPTPKERTLDKSIRLMVTGGGGRYGDWEIFKEPLETALKKYDGTGGKPMLRVFFMGATPDWLLPYMLNKKDPLANRCFYLHPTATVQLFNKIVRYVSPDIIISSTQKNDFNRSKSGLKYLEAALAGAAFLCTDYDTYSIAPNDACLKVDNVYAQWLESIEALVENATLRAQLTEKARDHVLANCTIEGHIKQRVEFYQSVLAGRVNNAYSPRNFLVGQAPVVEERVNS